MLGTPDYRRHALRYRSAHLSLSLLKTAGGDTTSTRLRHRRLLLCNHRQPPSRHRRPSGDCKHRRPFFFCTSCWVQREHRPQRPTERSDPTQHAKGRPGDCPGPCKGATTRRNVTQGGGGGTPCLISAWGPRYSSGYPPPPLSGCVLLEVSHVSLAQRPKRHLHRNRWLRVVFCQILARESSVAE